MGSVFSLRVFLFSFKLLFYAFEFILILLNQIGLVFLLHLDNPFLFFTQVFNGLLQLSLHLLQKTLLRFFLLLLVFYCHFLKQSNWLLMLSWNCIKLFLVLLNKNLQAFSILCRFLFKFLFNIILYLLDFHFKFCLFLLRFDFKSC